MNRSRFIHPDVHTYHDPPETDGWVFITREMDHPKLHWFENILMARNISCTVKPCNGPARNELFVDARYRDTAMRLADPLQYISNDHPIFREYHSSPGASYETVLLVIVGGLAQIIERNKERMTIG
jgi:hypothetical protein